MLTTGYARLLFPVLLILGVMLASSTLLAGDEETIQELIAKAQSEPDQQSELYAKVARKQVEVANDHFNQGDPAKAQEAVREAVSYAQKALVSAKERRKRLKQTDITLRKTSRRLADVARSLAFEDRPPVSQAVDEIEEIREQILDIMFGGKKKSDKKTPDQDESKSQVSL
jgi:tetratricopeptide (TPR) repeat protein